MSLPAIPPLFPESTFGMAQIDSLPGVHFFESARQAMQALATLLLRAHGRVLFVLPAYTCDSVIASLLTVQADMAFVDIDASLDMSLTELSEVINSSTHDLVVLVPTSLFGAPVRDYKALYPTCLVLEDRAQSLLSLNSSADFQLFSFGLGKMVSTVGGGALYSPRQALMFDGLPRVERNYFAGALAQSSIAQGLKWLWPLWELVKGRADEQPGDIALTDAEAPRLLGGTKARWMGKCLQGIDTQPRVALSNWYHANVPSHWRFEIPSGMPYLRYPVRASIQLTGVSAGSMYQKTVLFAERHKGRDCPGARRVRDSCLLPTHRLVSTEHQRAYVQALLALDGVR